MSSKNPWMAPLDFKLSFFVLIILNFGSSKTCLILTAIFLREGKNIKSSSRWLLKSSCDALLRLLKTFLSKFCFQLNLKYVTLCKNLVKISRNDVSMTSIWDQKDFFIQCKSQYDQLYQRPVVGKGCTF